MSGAIPPLPHYASMAWCSFKAQGQPYLLYMFKIMVLEPFPLLSSLPKKKCLQFIKFMNFYSETVKTFCICNLLNRKISARFVVFVC
jgi:hypothetical protein